jgi:hypothetical protein
MAHRIAAGLGSKALQQAGNLDTHGGCGILLGSLWLAAAVLL